jgi:hypothetical protein
MAAILNKENTFLSLAMAMDPMLMSLKLIPRD